MSVNIFMCTDRYIERDRVRKRLDINIYQIFDQKLKFKRNRNIHIFISLVVVNPF